jgi:hypothetical protein
MPGLTPDQINFLSRTIGPYTALGDERAVLADIWAYTPMPVDNASLLEIIDLARASRQRADQIDRIACAIAMPAIMATAWFLTFCGGEAQAASLSLPAEEWAPLQWIGYDFSAFMVLIVIVGAIDVVMTTTRQRRAEERSLPSARRA